MQPFYVEQLSEAAIRAQARDLVRVYGPNAAARFFGVTRTTALSLAADAAVAPGTLALIRERLSGANG